MTRDTIGAILYWTFYYYIAKNKFQDFLKNVNSGRNIAKLFLLIKTLNLMKRKIQKKKKSLELVTHLWHENEFKLRTLLCRQEICITVCWTCTSWKLKCSSILVHVGIHKKYIILEFNLKWILSLAGWIFKAIAGGSPTVDLAKWHGKWRCGSRARETWVDLTIYWQIAFSQRTSSVKTYLFHNIKWCLQRSSDLFRENMLSYTSGIWIWIQWCHNCVAEDHKLTFWKKYNTLKEGITLPED